MDCTDFIRIVTVARLGGFAAGPAPIEPEPNADSYRWGCRLTKGDRCGDAVHICGQQAGWDIRVDLVYLCASVCRPCRNCIRKKAIAAEDSPCEKALLSSEGAAEDTRPPKAAARPTCG